MASLTYRAIWRWHFHAGLFCIPFVIVLALSGSIYLFKPQIDAFADRGVDSLLITGPRATGEAQVSAALAAVPGSKLFSYEIPREPDDAVRVHVYSAEGAGRIVYVHPHSLAVLKIVPHTQRLTEIVKTLHGELLAGTAGSLLVELAACWAIIMLVSGLYLWWPRDALGLAGALYPRLRSGRRVFWRDLHAVTGMWVSTLALFLLISGLPWTTVWGGGFAKLSVLMRPDVKLGWTTSRAAEHHQHEQAASEAAVTTKLTIDQAIERVAPLDLAPPARIYLPNERQPVWRVRSETQNRPLEHDVELDANTGAIVGELRFADRPLVDRVVGIGTTAHEGQLFGWANQLLGLLTAVGLITLCVSAIVMWWRRRPEGKLGVPAPRVAGFRVGPALGTTIIALAVLLPVFGASLLLVLLAGIRSRSAGA